jgi:hypothetical protein
MKFEVMFPELNHVQLGLLKRQIEDIIGDDEPEVNNVSRIQFHQRNTLRAEQRKRLQEVL